MTKKIFALCALISINSFVGANGYPAQQGSQASEHHHGHHGHHHGDHHHNRDKITDEADEDRIKVLKELDESAAFYRNLSRIGIAAGGIVAGGNALFAKDKNFNAISGGIMTVLISGGANLLINSAEEARAKERKDILERRAKNNHHR